MDDYRPVDFSDFDSLTAAMHDAIRALTSCVPLPATGARAADYTHESNSDWFGAGADVLSHAAGWRQHLRNVGGAVAKRADHGDAGGGAGSGSAAPVHGAL